MRKLLEKDFPFMMDDFTTHLQANFLLWSMTLLLIMEEDVAMLAFMFS